VRRPQAVLSGGADKKRSRTAVWSGADLTSLLYAAANTPQDTTRDVS